MTSRGEAARRRPELDGVRGLAILLVVVGHGLARHRMGGLAAGGVTLFFALSGYLITGNLLREHAETGRVRLLRFYQRRLSRLGPPLLAMVVVVSVVVGAAWPAIAQTVTWTTNLASAAGVDAGPFGHTWSLAVEEQFYLVWPVALPLLMTCRRPLIALLAVVLLLMGWRILLFASGHYLWSYIGPETAGTAVLAGCAVALGHFTCTSREGTWCLVLLLTLSAGGSFFGDQIGALLVPILVTPAAACVVAAAGSLRWLTMRPLVACGAVSYSVYLWHGPGALLFGIDPLTPVGTAVGVAVGLVAYGAIEAPVMSARARSGHRHESTAPLTSSRP